MMFSKNTTLINKNTKNEFTDELGNTYVINTILVYRRITWHFYKFTYFFIDTKIN